VVPDYLFMHASNHWGIGTHGLRGATTSLPTDQVQDLADRQLTVR